MCSAVFACADGSSLWGGRTGRFGGTVASRLFVGAKLRKSRDFWAVVQAICSTPSGRGVFPGGHRSSPEGAQDCLRAGRGVLAGGMLAAVWWMSGHSGTGWGIAGWKRTSPATVLLVSRSGRGRACCRGSQPRVVGYVPWAFIRRRLRSGPRVRARCRSVRSASGPSCRSRGP